ncbi:MAG: hypothetical protein ACI8UO_002321 [Verrucomicrobiales bacterium]|jgi:uncharacterized protein (TIGR02600 family)
MRVRFRQCWRRQAGGIRGSAVLIVLMGITLVTVLALAFLGLARTETKASGSSAWGVQVRTLADTTVSLAIGQIREATENNGTTKTWASQPGMIRVYGGENPSTSTGRTELEAVFKLYSDDKMVETGRFDPNSDLPPGDWASRPGVFVDLNEPVAQPRQDGADIVRTYPIADGRSFDRIATGKAAVKGAEIDDSAPLAESNGFTNPVPMPVRWLYMLKDGNVIVPSSGDETITRFSGQKPSKQNPIVGRVAFWTDDETAKVNINTASEGVFWDTPRGNNDHDAYNYADKQPVQGEYQRYPGHPATTSLSPVLGSFIGDRPEDRLKYFALTPRISPGGSFGRSAVVTPITKPITVDRDRLYASIDEYLFAASKFAVGDVRSREHDDRGNSSSGKMEPSKVSLEKDWLDQSRFFLTAHSRSPEVNLFNKPRISIWPVQEKVRDRNAKDALIAFCSETNHGGGSNAGRPYYFQRRSVHPRGGGFGSSQSSREDVRIQRNQQLYDYLNQLMGEKIPGFGSEFSEKYPQDSEQIATSMMDYIRSQANTAAAGLPTESSPQGYSFVPPKQRITGRISEGEGQVVPLRIGDTRGFGRFATITEAALVIYASDYDRRRTRVDRETMTARVPRYGEIHVHRPTAVKAFLVLEFFTPSPGLPPWSPNMVVEIDGLESFGINGSNLRMPADGSVHVSTPLHKIPGQNVVNGSGDSNAHLSPIQPFFRGPNGKMRNLNSVDPKTGFAWHSQAEVRIDPREPFVKFQGGSLKITIRDPGNSEELQTISMSFPNAEMPTPFAFPNMTPRRLRNGSGLPAPRSLELSLQRRLETRRDWERNLIRPGDVVRSVEADINAPPKGDLRFYATTPNVPETWFRPGGDTQDDYFDKEMRFSHGLRNGNAWQYWGHFRGNTRGASGDDAIDSGSRRDHPYHRMSSFDVSGALVANVIDRDGPRNSGYRDYHPAVPRGLQGAANHLGRPGDWDQGYGNSEDGPFINKTDESSAATFAASPWDRTVDRKSYGGYFTRGYYSAETDGQTHAPNRQIASAVQFGSLPTGIKALRPWQTLLFCPNPSSRTTRPGDGIIGAGGALGSSALREPTEEDHPGFAFPRDHLLLDLFWMPVAEPYAISEPFSTAGKVNLNYDIMPFRYLKRRTGMHAVLQHIELMAVPPAAAVRRNGTSCYKGGRDQNYVHELRYGVNMDPEQGTLRGFEERFKSGEIFRSATEICELFLVPKPLDRPDAFDPRINANPPREGYGASYEKMVDWWSNFSITGDNVREMPYNHIYSRITTKSNSYEIHYRVQLLGKSPQSDPEIWDEGYDTILAEDRGSSLIERYIDPNDPDLPDFADPATFDDLSVDDYYQIRVIRRKRFAP